MTGEPRYLKLSDEEVMVETEKRLKAMMGLLAEIRDALKSAGGIE